MSKQINISETIDWYILAGVSEICGDKPCLVETEKKMPSFAVSGKKIEQNISSSISSSVGEAIKNARDICKKAQTLGELREIMLHFEGCNLRNTAASTVFGDGCETAKVMFIGEAPGADEDRMGKPFVGRCGKLLNKMFDAINIKREDCYITNVLPWRPPGNRPPTDDEIAVCLPFLKRQIELIKPDILVLLGGISLKSVMDLTDSISRTRGKWLEYTVDDKIIQTIATYHPSYLLRSSAQKAKVWADLLRLQSKIGEMK